QGGSVSFRCLCRQSEWSFCTCDGRRRSAEGKEAGGDLKTLHAVTLVGNPKIGSRTLQVAEEVTKQLSDWLYLEGCTVTNTTIDIAALGSGLFQTEDRAVTEVLQNIGNCKLLIAASPVYKASYTGVLKMLLDRLPMEALAGRVAIPVMVAAAPVHALAVETHFRPVLVELGACCPTRGVFVLESKLPELGGEIEKWLRTAKPMLAPLLIR
ncbi:MAG TPA: NAD(P)H-dependent oxidoreductase, partial [Xanthobacteraceae bacterium]|nr:NAD(P)H-dependent oxidoreductase [Xanthobacteraceae bacterium]